MKYKSTLLYPELYRFWYFLGKLNNLSLHTEVYENDAYFILPREEFFRGASAKFWMKYSHLYSAESYEGSVYRLYICTNTVTGQSLGWWAYGSLIRGLSSQDYPMFAHYGWCRYSTKPCSQVFLSLVDLSHIVDVSELRVLYYEPSWLAVDCTPLDLEGCLSDWETWTLSCVSFIHLEEV